jgi:hypothetical protein
MSENSAPAVLDGAAGADCNRTIVGCRQAEKFRLPANFFRR